MPTLTEFLREGFPFKKPSFGGAPEEAAEASSGEAPTSFGGAKTAESDAMIGMQNASSGMQGGGMPGGQNALIKMQQAKEKAKQLEQQATARAARQKAEEENAARLQTKAWRAQAEAEVSKALTGRLNDQADEVDFYPELMTFSGFNAQQVKRNTNATAGESRGANDVEVPNGTSKPKPNLKDEKRRTGEQRVRT